MPGQSLRSPLLPLLLVSGAGLGVYYNSFAGVFIYDDLQWIVDNQTLRQLWPLAPFLAETLRPVLFYTLALNYALSGLEPWSYHAVNLAIHLLAALCLYGLVRRSLEYKSQDSSSNSNSAAPWLALTIALLWTVHPLQTQSVTYIIQRGESLMGLLYLTALYCALRGLVSTQPKGWYSAALAAHTCGLGCKEVMVTALPMILLWDIVLVTGSLRQSLGQRWWLYGGLAAPGLVVAAWWLVQAPGQFTLVLGDATDHSRLDYALSQPGILLRYMQLAFWPAPLCLDYNQPLAQHWLSIALPLLVVAGLILVTLWGLVRRRLWSLALTWFFLILAPTSSLVPLQDLMVAHRTYLPLAGIIALTVCAAWALLLRLVPSQVQRRHAALALVATSVAIYGYLTIQRNAVFASEVSLWNAEVAQHPNNPRAHFNLGFHLSEQRSFDRAIAHYQKAIALKPDYAEAYANMGAAQAGKGLFAAAITAYQKAMHLGADAAEHFYNIGLLYSRLGKTATAIAHYQKALKQKPEHAEAHVNLGAILLGQGQIEQGQHHLRAALRLDSTLAEVHNNLGAVLVGQGRLEEALPHYHQAIKINPAYLDAHINIGIVLLTMGRFDQADSMLSRAVALDSLSAKAHYFLGKTQLRQGKTAAAAYQFHRALTIKPEYSDATQLLRRALIDLHPEKK